MLQNSYVYRNYLFFIFWLWLICPNIAALAQQTERTIVNKKQQIYIVSHGWHTGFVVPASSIQTQLPQLRERFADTPFIEFGWGDYDFYQAKEITPGITLKALFWPTASVIHAVAVPMHVNEYFFNSRVVTICLNEQDYLSLIQFIADSFYKNEAGKLLALKSGLYGNSQFYKGAGDFYLMNTCNQWTAKGLKVAGMNISPAFQLTADSVINNIQVRKNTPENNSSSISEVLHDPLSIKCQ